MLVIMYTCGPSLFPVVLIVGRVIIEDEYDKGMEIIEISRRAGIPLAPSDFKGSRQRGLVWRESIRILY